MLMNRESIKRDIAIIGISCKFSKSETPDQFWENLKKGDELVQFYTDIELTNFGIDKNTIDDFSYIKTKTFLNDSDSFDYPFFNYTIDEANLMDPQVRVLHEQVWSALEDAGCNPLTFSDKIGLYLTAADNFNWIAHSLMCENKNIDPFFLSQISNKNFISTLISYNLNLKGPSIIVDTACSSSLTAIHLAGRSLLLRECSMAVAGGIELKTSSDKGYFYREGMINSKDGHCRAFDSQSTGTTESEGGAVVVLKRLEDAIRDNDNIYAVMRSSSANNDGKRKVGYTAPSVIGQSECISMAHNIAKVPYNTISYVETHGTGTKLGDLVEIEALNKSFNYDTSHQCAIGSVKTNLGHLGKAAGIAGFIKTILSLKNKMIPPSLHYKNPNPEINFAGGPFFVNSQLKKWPQTAFTPLRAGVSSFGIGGTNVHVLLEEYQKKEKESYSRPYKLILYSARTEKSLNNYTLKLKDFVNQEAYDLADLAYTLSTGRAAFSRKRIIVCKSKEELICNLNENEDNFNVEEKDKREKKELIFMFSGQGTQYFKMGKELYEHEPEFKVIMDQGFEILYNITGNDYAQILGYKLNSNIDKNLVNETKYTQPIVFLFEYALASVLMKWEIMPNHMIGHSLGEYVAACIAEVFSLEAALNLILKRSELMNEVKQGSMLAIDAPIIMVRNLLTADLSIAAINSPNSVVVSGTTEDIENLINVLNISEISFSKLKTSHAFHSFMMDCILDNYEQEVNKIAFSKPKISFISNVTGKPILDDEATSPKYWVRHLRETVRFNDGIDFLLDKTNSVFIEVGAGRTLTTLCKQNEKYSSKNSTIELVRHLQESIDDSQKFTNAIGEIWNQGININWKKYYALEERNTISAPTYSFDTYKLDFIADPFSKIMNEKVFQSIRPLDDWFYIPNWKKAFLYTEADKNINKNQKYLIFSDKGRLITSLIDKLKEEGNTVIEINRGDGFMKIDDQFFEMNPGLENNLISLFEDLKEGRIQFEQIIFNWDFREQNQESLLSIFILFNRICKILTEHFFNHKIKITVLCDLGYEIFDIEQRNISLISSMKQLNVYSQENPNVFSCSIDVNQDENDSSTISKIIDDLQFNYTNSTVAVRNTNRWVEFYENIDLSLNDKNKYLKKNKTYLITGGLGKVGKILSSYLCETYDSKIIIIGRRVMPSEDLWQNILIANEADPKIIEMIKDFKELKRNYNQIYYFNADVSEFNSFNDAVRTIQENHGQISGVIHAAGNVDNKTFKAVENLNEEAALKQFLPKVQGTLNLYSIFKSSSLDFVWITSSLSSILGGLELGAYSVANAFIDSFITSKREELTKWFCINLDGIVQDRINDPKLVEVFERTLSAESHPQIIVSVKDIDSFKSEYRLINEKVELSDRNLAIDRTDLSTAYSIPATEFEIELCEIVQTFFGYKKIGALDNFFEMGGDSLKAMTLIKRINKRFGIDLNIQDFYSNPNVRQFSMEVELAVNLLKLQEKPNGENTIII